MERMIEQHETDLVDLGAVAELTRGGAVQPPNDFIGNQPLGGLSDD